MEIGLQIPDFTYDGGPARLGADLAEIARTADRSGFAYLAVMDHFFQIHVIGPPEKDMLEAYTTLGFLAAHTERVKLLTVVTGAFYRHPGLLAKTVTTLDVLSGGRAMLGVGAGWNEEEARGLGFRFPPVAERFELLEDSLRYCLEMWSAADKPFSGEHVEAERLLNVPQPLSRPHPPIMIGGGGEKKTLRFVAKYGQACNLFNTPDLEHKLGVLRAHCEREGRDYDEITKTVYHPLHIGEHGERVDELVGELRRLAGLGVDAVIGGTRGAERIEPLELIAREVIPVVAPL
ncbi:LLM class F420-dependent oxidoreductase [Amycolatopsis magusensis]|uniref:LLM class F420-dependent oxidoreductase n=1 Tax=Amycolatopsis magusensis TaxID=882444 RepID=UPI0037947CC8